MEPEHRALLLQHRLKLSEELLVTESIVQFLYQEEILSQHHVEEIESQPSSRQKSLKLLDILPSRGPRAFNCFLQALDDFSWVRDGLLLELQKGAARGHGATGVSTPAICSAASYHRWRCLKTWNSPPISHPLFHILFSCPWGWFYSNLLLLK